MKAIYQCKIKHTFRGCTFYELWGKKEEEERVEEDNEGEEKKRDGGREREGIRIYSL